jgi:outer membrane protein assembly factor BamB
LIKEKKNNPFISMALSENALIIADTIGKLFKVDFNSGKEIWNIKSPNPFNSQVKIYKDKVFIIDLNNVLRCFNISEGKELWKFNSENVFLKSNKRKSLAIKDNVVYFTNSLGDIIAVNANNGNLIWQLPTQSSMIYENSFSLKVSDLVIFENNIFFSNNKNEFYSINRNNGIINWKQNINSNIKPIIVKDFIFSISNDGYLFVVDRNSGNIIKITDIFDLFKIKERKDIFPVGFIAGNNNLFVSTSNGKVIYVDLKSGKSKSAIKLSGGLISPPFVIDSKIFIIKENAVLKLN